MRPKIARPDPLSPTSTNCPTSGVRTRAFAIPEIKALRELRFALARGGLPSVDKRTPEDDARIAAFRVLEELMRLLDGYRRKVEAGERCRIVEREHVREPSQLLIELRVEQQPRS